MNASEQPGDGAAGSDERGREHNFDPWMTIFTQERFRALFHHNPSRVKIKGMKPLNAASTVRKAAVKTSKAASTTKAIRRTPEPEPKPYHHGNLRQALVEAEHHPTLEGGGGVVEVDDRLAGADDALVGTADQVVAALGEFPTLKVAAECAFGLVHAAAHAHDAKGGSELALVCWSFSHGLSNLLIDGAFDGLPMELPAASVLTRQLAQRVLQLA